MQLLLSLLSTTIERKTKKFQPNVEKMRLSQHFDANFYNKNVSILHIIKVSEEEREKKFL